MNVATKPTVQPPRPYLRPYLRRRFFVRRHRLWGAAVCWYAWDPLFRHWVINWGIACRTMREAKTIRKFLDNRVQRFPSDYGVRFEAAVQLAKGRTSADAAHRCRTMVY